MAQLHVDAGTHHGFKSHLRQSDDELQPSAQSLANMLTSRLEG